MEKKLKVAYKMLIKSKMGEWYEQLDGWNGSEPPTTDKEAKKQALETVNYFNDTLREGEEMRHVVRLKKTEKLERVTEIEL